MDARADHLRCGNEAVSRARSDTRGALPHRAGRRPGGSFRSEPGISEESENGTAGEERWGIDFPHWFQTCLRNGNPEGRRELRRCGGRGQKECTRAKHTSAGSDPPWTAFRCPKVFWGRSRPSLRNSGRVLPACRNRSTQLVMQSVMDHKYRKENKVLALLKAPSKQPKTATLQVRLEQEVRYDLDRYAEFLDANPSYVVSEALKLLFKKDAEFKRWAADHANNHKAVLKGESIQPELK